MSEQEQQPEHQAQQGKGIKRALERYVGRGKAAPGRGDAPDRFAKFTERARSVLSLAQQEAQRLNHSYIGTEHLLLGLVREGDGVAAVALRDMGVELEKVRGAVEHIIGHGEHETSGEIGLTRRAKKVLEMAVDEAKRMGHRYIGTEHLLLGLMREGDGVAAGVLESLGITLERTRMQIVQTLETGGVSEAASPKNTVITCRLDDRAIDAIDALIEAGIRSTRSDAAAWLIGVGIEAQRPLLERVYATVDQIRQLRVEAREIARVVSGDAPVADAAPPGTTP